MLTTQTNNETHCNYSQHNQTKKCAVNKIIYLFALWAFAAPAVKLMKMCSWFAGAFLFACVFFACLFTTVLNTFCQQQKNSTVHFQGIMNLRFTAEADKRPEADKFILANQRAVFRSGDKATFTLKRRASWEEFHQSWLKVI